MQMFYFYSLFCHLHFFENIMLKGFLSPCRAFLAHDNFLLEIVFLYLSESTV